MEKFVPERFEGPGGDTAAQEIVVPCEDARSQGQRQGNRWPIVGIARDAPPGDGFEVVVRIEWDDFDGVVIEEALDFTSNYRNLIVRDDGAR